MRLRDLEAALFSGPRRIVVGLAIRAAEWRTVGGTRVGVVVPASFNEEECLERIQAALRMIETVLPHRARRIKKDVRNLLCFGTGRDEALGAYVPLFHTCLLDPRHVLDPKATVADLAGTILHEAAHCRIHRAGINARCGRRDRIEALCVRSQRELGKRIQTLHEGEE